MSDGSPLRALPSAMLRKLTHIYRGAFSRYDIESPVIVFQMGKVGSMSVYRELSRLRLNVPVYHSHILEVADDAEEVVRAARPNPSVTLTEIERGRELRRQIDADPRQWNVISLVRDPVARNLSYFFEVLAEAVPDAHERIRAGEISIEEVCERFFHDRTIHHDSATSWFDVQLKGVFGIDVFSRPFPRHRGFDIYEGPRARLLVMRLEDLDACVSPAMEQFLGISPFRLRRENVGEAKWYGELYRRFKAEISLSSDYLDGSYRSEYARHFYSEEEILRFRTRYQRPI